MYLISRGLAFGTRSCIQTGRRAPYLRVLSLHMSSARPTLDDVERISKGQAAKRRGTGSRAVPHRLNESERQQWDLAKKKKFLVLRGTGWRKERGDSPLANIYRQLCDSQNIPCISVCQGLGVGEVIEDTVVIDFSPLRTTDFKSLLELCIAETSNAEEYSSISCTRDLTDTSSWEEDLVRAFEEDAIWRIPSFKLEVCFKDRTESKKFAEAIANKLINKKAET